MSVSYRLTIGSWSVDSSSDARTEALAIETSAALGSADTSCRIVLYAPLVDGRQLTFEPNDPITVELTSGDTTETVFTGVVHSIRSTLRTMIVEGRGGIGKLAVTRVNTVYTSQSAQQIASDLASQAEVDTGDLVSGDTYHYVVAHESMTALEVLRRIARVEGADLYADPDNKLTIKKFEKQTADYTFRYAVDVLDARLVHHDAPTSRVLVAGESAASTNGDDSWHVLVKDPDAFLGDSGDGAHVVALHEGLVRTKAAAQRLADATVADIGSYATYGRLAVLGHPGVRLGDSVAVEDAPSGALNATFKVTRVRHVYAKNKGYVTVIDVVAMGGEGVAGAADDAMSMAGGFL